MTNPFNDQAKFMWACDQTTTGFNEDQYRMYLNLIVEECKELSEALEKDDKKEMLDALTDILVVTIGAINSAGFDGEGAWNEVMRTNFAKIDPTTGKVSKRADGKVLKPLDWQPPELEKYLQKTWIKEE